jgi:hypothetical protein
LCPNGRNPDIFLDTYDLKAGVVSKSERVPTSFADFDGVWNFVYFAYSKKEEKASIYI